MKVETFKNYEKKNRELIDSYEINDEKMIISQLAMVFVEKQEYSVVYNNKGTKDIRTYNKIVDKDGNELTIVRTFYVDLY